MNRNEFRKVMSILNVYFHVSNDLVLFLLCSGYKWDALKGLTTIPGIWDALKVSYIASLLASILIKRKALGFCLLLFSVFSFAT